MVYWFVDIGFGAIELLAEGSPQEEEKDWVRGEDGLQVHRRLKFF